LSPKKKRLIGLLLTERAICDLLDIEAYSIEQWGKRTAAKYLKEIESSLRLIRDDPSILRPLEGLPAEVRFYPVNKHLLVCDVRSASIVVLTVIHASMDVPRRLAELVPQLAAEVATLHERLASGRR
jgi:toxin ParE1/3/4